MRIQTKLIVVPVIVIVALVGVAIWGVYYLQQIDSIRIQEEAAREISRGVAEENILIIEYLVHQNERQVQQWEKKHATVSSALTQLEEQYVSDPEEQKTIQELRTRHQNIRQAFSRLIEQTDTPNAWIQFPLQPNQSQNTAQLLTIRLIAVLSEESHQMFIQANSLVETNYSRRGDLIQLISSVATVGVTVLIILAVGLTIWIQRSVLKPMRLFYRGVQRVRKGDPHYRIAVTTNDEVGVLTEEFNLMAFELNEKNTELQQRIQDSAELLEALQFERDKLQEVKVQDDAIFESIGEGLLVTDKERRVVMMNSAAAHMVGWSADDIVDSLWPDILGERGVTNVNGDVVPTGALPIHLAITEGKRVTENSYLYTRKNGEILPVLVTAAPVLRDGNILGAVLVFRDNTKEHEVDKMKSEFVSIASHQLRTPLTGVKWATNMLLQEADWDNLSTTQKKLLHRIDQSNQRMIDLVNDLLSVSRIEDIHYERLPRKRMNIIPIFQAAIDDTMLFAADRGVAINIPDRFPKKLEATVEPDSLEQAFRNVIANAVKYSYQDGKVEIRVIEADTEYVFSIQDDGLGIPDSEQHNVFKKFFRAQNTQNIPAHGTGLGMYITKVVIEQHGGRVWFDSSEGEGTTFYIALPKQPLLDEE